MPEISSKALIIAIQTVEAEIQRIIALPANEAVPGDDIFLNDLENIADELQDVYATAEQAQPNLPPYEQLVNRPH